MMATQLALADDLPPAEPPIRPYVDFTVGAKESGEGSGDSRFLLGAAVTSAPEYAGASERKLSLRPLFAYRYKRFRISSSSSGSLMNFGDRTEESGASLDLLDSSRWSIKTGLRLGGGRDTSDSDRLAGLPDIRKTVLGRASIAYSLTPNWRWSGALTGDLVGRGNGIIAATGLDYRLPLSQQTEFTAGTGLNFGNGTHMNGFFGVPESARTADREAYRPGAGLRDVGIGIGLTTIISPGWVAFGNLGYSRLLGAAADSPLTRQTGGASATVGIAWRCCR